jgi:hypothetical protein
MLELGCLPFLGAVHRRFACGTGWITLIDKSAEPELQPTHFL